MGLADQRPGLVLVTRESGRYGLSWTQGFNAQGYLIQARTKNARVTKRANAFITHAAFRFTEIPGRGARGVSFRVASILGVRGPGDYVHSEWKRAKLPAQYRRTVTRSVPKEPNSTQRQWLSDTANQCLKKGAGVAVVTAASTAVINIVPGAGSVTWGGIVAVGGVAGVGTTLVCFVGWD